MSSGCFLRALDRVSETRVTIVTEAALLQPHQKSQVAQCIIYRSYVFLLPGLVAFRQRIVHPLEGHSFKVLIFKAVVAEKKKDRPSLAAGQLLGANKLMPRLHMPPQRELLNISLIKVYRTCLRTEEKVYVGGT